MRYPQRQLFAVAAVVVATLLPGGSSRADTPAGVAEYIVPFDEDVFAYTTSRVTGGNIPANSTSRATVDVTAWSNTVRLYYDHWEDGYDLDPVTLTGADEVYELNVGQTLTFLSAAIPRPRTGANGNSYVGTAGNCWGQAPPGTPISRTTVNYCYDGRDRFFTVGGATTVTRGGWLAATDIHAAVGEEVYPLAPQLIKYVLPFGEDGTRVDYERVVAVIQATEDDTTIQIDFDADGAFDSFNTENGYRTARTDPTDATSLTLQRGQSYVLDRDSDGVGGSLQRGVVILGSKTLQVEYFYGDYNSTYNTRAVAAYPRGFWSDEYYAPVDGAPGGFATDVTLYNPNATTLTVQWATTAGAGSFTMAPNETAFFQAKTGGYVPDGSALYLKGDGVFWGISDIDTNSSTYDWSYSLVPSYLLKADQFVSWAPGNSPVQPPPDADGRAQGIFVTPVQDRTRFFIDRDADGIPETTYEVLRGATAVTPTGGGYEANRLESLYITDNDGDMTGAHIWATGPFAMAYGENPQRATASGAVDLGYTSLPSPANWMDLALTVAKSTNPVVISTVAGATTATFTIHVESHLFDLSTVDVVDTLPANWTYVANSSTITFPNLTQLTGAAAEPTTVALPNLTWSGARLGGMQPNQRITITFQARTTAAFASGALTQNNVQAIGTRTVGSVTSTFRATDFVFNTYLNPAVNNMTVAKTTGAADPVSPGDTIPYTVTVTNPGSAALTGFSLSDPMPRGVTYVPGSGLVTIYAPASAGTFADTFDSVSYSNSNGTLDWSGQPWTETDPTGGGAASGAVLVTGGQLRLTHPFNVRDQFDSQSYSLNGPFNTANWTGSWSEVDAYGNGATGASGGFVWATGTQLQFQSLPRTFRDNFESVSYSNSDGTSNWAGNWTEGPGLDGVPGTVNNRQIYITGGRLRFDRSNSGTNFHIRRTANVTAGSNLTVSFTPYDEGIDAGEAVVAEYQVNSAGAFIPLATFDGGTGGWDGVAQSFLISDFSGTSITLRFRATTAWNANGDHLDIDDVQIQLAVDTAGTQIRRSANLAGAATATLTFDYSAANLEAGDTLVVEASPDGTSFTTLEAIDGATGGGTRSFNLVSPINYATANTAIRFRVAGGFDEAGETFSVDNVDINYTPAQPSIQRTANLSGWQGASLTFSYATGGVQTPEDSFVIEASSGPSGPFTPLATVAAGVPSVPSPYDLTPYISAGTTIRFRLTGGYAPSLTRYLDIDDVTVTGRTFTTTTFPASDPPSMLPTSAGRTIPAGGKAVLTFSATVDGTLPAGQTEIRNVATAIATEIPLPISDDAVNQVLNPSAASATVGDRVWLDADGDGIQDLGEAGIPGVEVTLKDQWGTPLQAVTTDSQGRYTFVNVPPGSGYFVAVTGGVPSGLVQSSESRTDNRTNSFDLAPGQVYLSADIGYEATGSTATIGDLVWIDADGDTLRDPGEPGLAGVTVQLLEDTNGDGIPDVLIATTVTGPDGTYLFAGIVANGVRDYFAAVSVAQSALAAYNITTPTNYGYPNVPAGASYVSADFGFRQKATGTTYSITDRVWLDNGSGPGGVADDGSPNGTEPGISGVTVVLEDGAGNVIATTTTGSTGVFSFTGVPAGANYRWRVTDSAHVLTDFYPTTAWGVARVFQMAGNLGSDLVYTAAPHFGYDLTRAIGDTVWNDIDASGTQNGLEPGIAGVAVLLYRDVNGDGIFQPGGADGSPAGTLLTDPNGRYLFTGLAGGSYWVSIDRTQTALSGYTSLTTADDSGVAGDQRLVSSVGGVSVLGIDFGYRAPTSYALSGKIWNDTNANGAINGEPGISGITLEVLQGGTVIGTATTDAAGSFSFPGLPQGGTYSVRVTDDANLLSGFTATYEKTEGANALAYDGQETVANLSANVTDLNFGFYRPQIPTLPVSLAWFRATAGARGTLLEWETSAEAGNVGFNVLGDLGSRKARLNDELIPSKVVSALTRSSYSLELPAGPTRFWLEEVDLEGQLRQHGPFALGGVSGLADEAQPVAWMAIREESEAKQARRVEAVLNGPVRPYDAGIRLVVDREGMFRVTYEELRKAGLDLAGVEVQGLALTNRGRSVPTWLYSPSGIAVRGFGPGSFLVFWGEHAPSLYTDENVYILRVDPVAAQSAMTIDARSPDPKATPAASYVETVRVDRNRAYSFSSPTGDPWYDTRILAYKTPVRASFSLDLDDVAPGGEGLLTVGLWGSTDWPQSPDHHAIVSWNGRQVADETFDGIANRPLSIRLDATQLQSRSNQLDVLLPGDTGVDYDLVMLDSYSVSYPRKFRARADRLAFDASFDQLAVDGFSTPDVYVFRRPGGGSEVQRLAGVVVERTAAGYRARFPGTTAASPSPDRYQVTTGSAFLVPRIEPGRPGLDLSLAGRDVKLLVIAHPDFLSGVAPLAAARSAQGVSTHVVDVESVYETYSGGVVDPAAIRDFVRFAHRAWGTRSVLLVGGDTYDYRNALGLSSKSFVPTLYAETDPVIVRFAPADALYGDVDGDGVPEVAVGRFPVRTSAELDLVVAKTLAWAGARSAVLAADQSEGSLNFSTLSNGLAALFPQEMKVSRAYMDALGLAGARAALKAQMNQGGAFVGFLGHSSYARWSFAGLFTTADAAALTNSGRPNVVNQFGCWNNYFVEPTYNTLGHVLLLSGDRGAAATLGMATLSDVSTEGLLGPILTPRLLRPGTPIGQALVEAKAEVARIAPNRPDVQVGMTLLGDPELVLVP